MIPEYEYIITGFLFGLIVAIDLMCILNIINALIKKKKQKRTKNEAKADLPRVYREAPRRKK